MIRRYVGAELVFPSVAMVWSRKWCATDNPAKEAPRMTTLKGFLVFSFMLFLEAGGESLSTETDERFARVVLFT